MSRINPATFNEVSNFQNFYFLDSIVLWAATSLAIGTL